MGSQSAKTITANVTPKARLTPDHSLSVRPRWHPARTSPAGGRPAGTGLLPSFLRRPCIGAAAANRHEGVLEVRKGHFGAHSRAPVQRCRTSEPAPVSLCSLAASRSIPWLRRKSAFVAPALARRVWNREGCASPQNSGKCSICFWPPSAAAIPLFQLTPRRSMQKVFAATCSLPGAGRLASAPSVRVCALLRCLGRLPRAWFGGAGPAEL